MKILIVLLLLATLTACESSKPKDISIVQQFSPSFGEWQDVILVYGYWNNYEEANLIAEHYRTINKEREYRVASKKISTREYEHLRNHIAKP